MSHFRDEDYVPPRDPVFASEDYLYDQWRHENDPPVPVMTFEQQREALRKIARGIK